ncbi:hypothetical protein F5Y16DRAFT_415646 [Xylariaceae sp. FL0255]|nr:hypothetical protein F5Y16DRAFT_415646 [Xylariaceae sp. FL0255]
MSLSEDNYTVGWICAVGEELVAAQNFLDEKHDAPDHVPANDNNTYTLGRVGKHNIVIAAMPHWQYGLVNAAIVARDMVRSFPNVRIGLMVGIAGGAPSPKHDIRLGDIVVASPGYANGGVLQYDYGMTIQNSEFRTTGYLNQPPLFILNAMNTLKAEYEADGHTIDISIQSVLEKKRRLKTKYCRPDPNTDRLYKTQWTHAGNNDEDCSPVCGIEHLITRPERSDDEDNPAIHYGLIASANQVMKDASLRDKLSADKDVLCFEMEAAGLMNHFPCLVIRGICDYSDTHKNVRWQGYAAMAAAAYAKDLLYKIAPNNVEAERRLVEVLQEVQEDVTQVKSGVQSLRAEAHFDHISKWLSPPDPSINFNKTLESRHPGSGKWFLDHAAYSRWKSEKNSFLWLHGIPGCGKTVLSSTVIEDLSRNQTAPNLLYFYFDFTDDKKQSTDMMLRSLISQMHDSCENVRCHVDSLYSAHNKGKTEPSSESLRRVFQEMVHKAGEAWIVLDALDECPQRNEYSEGALLSWISHLHELGTNIHLLVTSRLEQDIEAALKRWAQDRDVIPLQSDLVQRDINAYIRNRVREQGVLSERWRTRPEIQAEIEVALTKKADGMFRWASCQLDVLENCIGPPEVRKALAHLPKTLDETYAQILANIPNDHKQVAIRILQFLTYSDRPLTLEEAVDCIAVDINARHFDRKTRTFVRKEISRYCSGLVVVAERQRNSYDSDDKTPTVTEIRLAHFSVKECLVSGRLNKDITKDFEALTAKMSLASVSVIYLLKLEHHLPIELIKQQYPLATYAAQYWANYAAGVDTSVWTDLGDLITKLFVHKEAFEACYRLYPLDTPWMEEGVLKIPQGLYYASFAGLLDAVQSLIDQGADVNARGGHYGNPLQAASYRGHENIVRVLLDNGADINAQCGFYGNALQAALSEGYENIAKLLNGYGSDESDTMSIISDASSVFSSASTVVDLLLQEKADVNAAAAADHGRTALQAAAGGGHLAVVERLLQEKADVNAAAAKYDGRTALQAAAGGGHLEAAKRLRQAGAVN